MISFLFSPGWSKSKSLLDVLPDRHGAEDVQEDKAAVGVVIAQQITVRKPLKRCNTEKYYSIASS